MRMNPRMILRLLLPCLLAAAAARAQTTRPNFLVLIADDLGWNDIGYHSPKVVTPALDGLAKEGVRLERFYTYPLCSPARAALLTGLMPRRLGIVDVVGPGQPGLPKGITTLPGILRAAGYQTSLIGKWHLGVNPGPQAFGFDHFYGFLSAELDYFEHTDKRGRPDWQRDGRQIEEKGYTTYLFADEAVRQLRQRDPAKPFYIQVAFNAPHIDLAAPPELVEKHKADGLYGAVIEGLDIGIGRILAALDKEGLRKNTCVVFFSDNGGARGIGSNLPLRSGKDTVFEGGIRTPAVLRWPGRLAAGTTSAQPVAVNDLFPTLLRSAAIPAPTDARLDGADQWQALSAGQVRPRPPFLIASHEIALIDGDWKLIEDGTGQRSLYDLRTDIAETKDLSAAQPEVLSRLGALLDGLKKDLPADKGRQRPGPGGKGKGGPKK